MHSPYLHLRSHYFKKSNWVSEIQVQGSPWIKLMRNWIFIKDYEGKNYGKIRILLKITKLSYTIQVSSMIHSARPIVSEHCFLLFSFLGLKSMDWCTDGRTTCAKTMIPTGRDFGLAEWINSGTCCTVIFV